MKKIIFFILFLLVLPQLHAQETKTGHTKLLAVTETDSGYEGSTADLYLEIQPGSGRVFIESFPLTKFDTQISTRFAKEIACQQTDTDCTKYDFFYTIQASTAIVGGPSAGAATSLLTISVLKGQKLDEKSATTGTINSGGVIGPVGSIKEKIKAASEAGLKRVLIPKGERFLNESSGVTDLYTFGSLNGVDVIEVSDLSEAYKELTGVIYEEETGNITVDEEYRATMSRLSGILCNESRLEGIDELGVNESKGIMETFEKGKKSISEGRYYSAASYCFSANVRWKYQQALIRNLSSGEIIKRAEKLKGEIDRYESGLSYKTITDLQTFVIVKERLGEARYYAERTGEAYNDTVYNLIYAEERFNSALAWGNFFGGGTAEYRLNINVVKKSCLSKLSEAEERFQYVKLFFPNALESTKTGMDRAYRYLNNNSYELCLYEASKAKAEADVVLNVLGISESQLGEIAAKKLELVKREIYKETKKGIFPIIGYSYYEYADSLKEGDVYSALLYSEYALELSNLDLYFEKISQEPAKKEGVLDKLDRRFILAFAIGAASGFVLAFAVMRKTKRIVRIKKA